MALGTFWHLLLDGYLVVFDKLMTIFKLQSKKRIWTTKNAGNVAIAMSLLRSMTLSWLGVQSLVALHDAIYTPGILILSSQESLQQLTNS